MQRIRLVIFDLDGTLVDAYKAIIKSFNYTMQKLNYSTQTAPSIRRAVGWGDENLLKPFVIKKDLEKAVSVYRQHHRLSLTRYSRLFPRVEKVLNHLKNKGYKLAIASNRPSRFSWILIRHLKINKYFNYVLCADRIKYIKPHPHILKKIMQRLGLKPQQTLYVGDMAIDAQAGRRAKVKTLIVSTGSSKIEEIRKEKPYRIIQRISELLNIL